jgi:HD superfamily phosphohydrolase
MEKILGRFTIDKVVPLLTESRIKGLLEKIKAAPGTQIEYDDPIHGQMELPDWLIKVINTPPVLRLAEVGQMPLTGHSRLAHSIGVAILALRQAEVLCLSEQNKKELTLIALLHDVGHGPFSHMFEKIYLKRDSENNSKEMFDHDKHRQKLLHSEKLSMILTEVGVDPYVISSALHSPKENWMAYLAKEILDRVDYLCRDSDNSGFSNAAKAWIKTKAQKILGSIKLDSDKILFAAHGEKSIDLFMAARLYTFKALAYDPHKSIAESLISRAIREKLAKFSEELQPKVVEALSYFSDSQLIAMLPLREQEALASIFKTGSSPLVVSLSTEHLSDPYKGWGSIKPSGVLEILESLNGDDQKRTWLVAIVPASTPAMTFNISKKTGEIRTIRVESPLTGSKRKECEIGTISIAALNDQGLITPSPGIRDEILKKFRQKGWLSPSL